MKICVHEKSPLSLKVHLTEPLRKISLKLEVDKDHTGHITIVFNSLLLSVTYIF